MSKYFSIEQKIIFELTKTLQLGGFGSDYLGIVGSFKDTQSDIGVLSTLALLNETFDKQSALFIIKQLMDNYQINTSELNE